MMDIGQVKERNPNSNDISDGMFALSWSTDANRAVGEMTMVRLLLNTCLMVM
jgi:hypothetical protein